MNINYPSSKVIDYVKQEVENIRRGISLKCQRLDIREDKLNETKFNEDKVDKIEEETQNDRIEIGIKNGGEIRKTGLKEPDEKRDIKQISILYFNARSMKNKLDELKIMVKDKKPNVIAIVETWLTEDIFDNELVIEDFNFVRIDRKSDQKARGGGVIIYVSLNLSFINVTSDLINNIDYG